MNELFKKYTFVKNYADADSFDPDGERNLVWFKRGHRELWEWVEKNPLSRKSDWFPLIYLYQNGISIRNDCFACEYAYIKAKQREFPVIRDCTVCALCPAHLGCNEVGSPWEGYYKAFGEGDPVEVRKFAKLIKEAWK